MLSHDERRFSSLSDSTPRGAYCSPQQSSGACPVSRLRQQNTRAYWELWARKCLVISRRSTFWDRVRADFTVDPRVVKSHTTMTPKLHTWLAPRPCITERAALLRCSLVFDYNCGRRLTLAVALAVANCLDYSKDIIRRTAKNKKTTVSVAAQLLKMTCFVC